MDLRTVHVRQRLYVLVSGGLMFPNAMSEMRHDRSNKVLDLAVGLGQY